MTTYTTPLIVQIMGQPVTVGQVPSSYSFNLIFTIAIVLMVVIGFMSLFVRNYTFRKNPAQQDAKLGTDPPRKYE
jgi:heme/copper-type cytochrome/quinol oxidase subunit 2